MEILLIVFVIFVIGGLIWLAISITFGIIAGLLAILTEAFAKLASNIANIIKIISNFLITKPGLILSFVVISSSIYLVENYVFYYYGKAKNVESEFKQYETVLTNLYAVNAPENIIADTINRSSFSIKIKDKNNNIISNDKYVDDDRSVLNYNFDIQSKSNTNSVEFMAGIRPNPIIHLYRAWTFSFVDLLKSPRVWIDKELYMRSIPLAFAWIITIVLIYIHKNIHSITIKKKEAEFNNKKLEIEKSLNNKISSLQTELHSISRKISEVEREKVSLRKEKEKVYTELISVTGERDSAKHNAKLLEKNEQSLKHQIEHTKAKADEEIDELQKRYSEIISERDEIKRLLIDVANTTNNSDLDHTISSGHGNVLSIGSFIANDFEKRTVDTLNNYIIDNNKKWKLYHDYDVGRFNTGPMCTDIILVTDKVAFVLELKCYNGKIISQGDYKNEPWYISKSDSYKKVIYSCHGNNPYKQVKTYADSYRNKLQRAGVDDIDTIGAVVFDERADISRLGDNHNNGLVTINKFFYILSANRLIDFVEMKNYGDDKIIPYYEELPKAM